MCSKTHKARIVSASGYSVQLRKGWTATYCPFASAIKMASAVRHSNQG